MTTVKAILRIAVVFVVAACGGGAPASVPASPTGSTAAPTPTAAVTPNRSAAASGPVTASPTAAASAAATASAAVTPAPTTASPTDVPPTAPPPSVVPSASAAPVGNLIEVFAGGGAEPVANGLPALEAQLLRPSGVSVARDGAIWIVDANLSLLMRIDADGTLADVTTGMTGPHGLTVLSEGSDPSARVYIADTGGYRILLADRAGGVTRVAGEFHAGFRGDGGPARRAWLWGPADVATDDDGNLYIADSVNNRIRWIDPTSGKIDTIVGNGTAGFSGDGGPATDAEIYNPQAIAVDPAGSYLLVADTGNGRIRRVDLVTGIITTIAGTGTGTVPYNPALTALQTPLVRLAGIALDPQGNVYFEVAWGDLGVTVMRLDSAGLLTLVAGGGRDLSPGGPALDFAMPDIIGLAIDPTTGALLICSSDSKVYRVPGVAAPQI